MKKSIVSEVIETARKQVRTKVRKSLQTIQLPADEQKLLEKNMVLPKDEAETSMPTKKKHPITVVKVTAAEKENTFAVRRSKRKNAVSGTLNYAESPDESKTIKSSTNDVPSKTKFKKSVAKPKKVRSAVKKSEPGTELNQTKLNFSSVTSVLNKNQDSFKSVDEKKVSAHSPSSEVTEDSGFDRSTGTSDQSSVHSSVESNLSVVKSSTVTLGVETSILTDVNAPISYWKDLAEQRRIALEKVLHENELLHDQLAVFEAENSQLKQLVKEAENLAQVVAGIIQ